MGVTFAGYLFSKRQVDEKVEARFSREANQVVDLVAERMQKYEDALWSGVSAIDALGGDATDEQWHRFAASMQLEQKYPGINGIGVIHHLEPDELDAYLGRQRTSRPWYRVHPPHDQPDFWPITYIEPVGANRAAVGLDMAHERNRYAAAKKARDTRRAQVTGPIVLVQDAEKTPGFLFFAPFFAAGPIEREGGTAAERCGGLVYAPFVVKRLMQGTLHRATRNVGVRIIDGEKVLYDEHHEGDPSFDATPQFRRRIEVPMYGRVWTFDLRSDKTFRKNSASSQPLTILIGGATIDLLLLALFLGLARSNRRAVAYAEAVTVELRAQKSALEQRNDDLRNQSEALEQARAAAERALEKAEAATAAKTRFLATMSHELRTPMNGVLATADLLLDAQEASERRELTETIITSGQTLLALINDILDFSKLEAGKVRLDPQPIALRRGLSEILRLLAPLAEEKALRIEAEVEPEVPDWVRVDGLRLRQILLNLCSNAVKFTEAGHVVVRCRRESGSDPAVLHFEVEDTGIGIADPEALFEEFKQADDSTTRRFGGTGLGLAISKRLVTAMGGRIGVESTLGRGARFWFSVPVQVLAPGDRDVASSKPVVRQRPSGRPAQGPVRRPVPEGKGADAPEPLAETARARALVVDDNRINRMVARKVLERLGWAVDLAEDGERGVEAALASHYDLILMDCQMPTLDGLEATRRIRRQSAKSPPIVALTANALPENRRECEAAGMCDLLAKPIRREDLAQVVHRWVPQAAPPAADEGNSVADGSG